MSAIVKGADPTGAPIAGRGSPMLAAEGISAGYGQVPIVKEVSLEVCSGEVVLIMGPNGAGKSTLVKAMTGTLGLLGGRVLIDGKDVSRLREDERMARGIGYVPQVRDVFGPLTVLENLEMGAYRMKSFETAGRLAALFEMFPTLAGLRRRQARTLSGGERKLLGIARALMADPRILVLDEPTANLSPLIAQSVLDETVARLAGHGRAILLIEQRVSLGLGVASWGYVLTDGQVRLSASAADLSASEDLSALFLGLKGARPARARNRRSSDTPA